MTTEQVNIRLDSELLSALERVAREESLDRATAIRRLLESSIKQWELERAITGYQRGDVSLARAAEEAGRTQWELIDAVRAAGLAYPLDAAEVERRLDELEAEVEPTLPDIPPQPGGVLLVGINPAPVSVQAGHYYQGRVGRRLWQRLQRLGLLRDAVPGAEDEAFARAGHGVTDLVKRPTRSSKDLSDHEIASGVETLRSKIHDWRPGLVLFAFKEPGERVHGKKVGAGPGPKVEGVRTFLLSGPYAPRAEAARIDDQLRELVTTRVDSIDRERSQRVTETDLAAGRIRFPRTAKRFFPSERGRVEIVLRGSRISGSYDPRTVGYREHSAVLILGRERLAGVVRRNEVLTVSRGLAGVIRLD
jgi:TDG/mug DNA glycosylase family protein